MISVTKLNNTRIIVNAEMIRYVESTPDTIITLTTNDKLMVKESVEEVVRKCVDYGRMLRRLIEPT